MIHKAYTKAEIAFRYYQIISPDKYDREQARKQFAQDPRIDREVVKQVTDTIHKEQRELLKRKP